VYPVPVPQADSKHVLELDAPHEVAESEPAS